MKNLHMIGLWLSLLSCEVHSSKNNLYSTGLLIGNVDGEKVLYVNSSLVSSLYTCIQRCEHLSHCAPSSVLYEPTHRTCTKLAQLAEGDLFMYEDIDPAHRPSSPEVALLAPEGTRLLRTEKNMVMGIGRSCAFSYIAEVSPASPLIPNSALIEAAATLNKDTYVLFAHSDTKDQKITVCIGVEEQCYHWYFFRDQADFTGIANQPPSYITQSAHLLMANGRTVWFLGSWDGGYGTSGTYTSMLYDLNEESWTPGPIPPHASKLTGMVQVTEHEILIYGGLHGSGLKTSHIYNTEADTWTATGLMPTGNFEPQAHVMTDSATGKPGVLSFSGQNWSRDMLWFDLQTKLWTVKSTASLPNGYAGTLLRVSERLLFFAHKQPGGGSSDVLEIDPQTLTVTHLLDNSAATCGSMGFITFTSKFMEVVSLQMAA